MKTALYIALIAITCLAASGIPSNWKVQEGKPKITFKVKGPMGVVDGSFSGLQADIIFDTNKPQAGTVAASVDVNTIQTGIKLRDRDLVNEGTWFDAAKYPRISFKSKEITKTASGYSASGDLTLKNITKPITIPFTFEPKGSEGVFTGSFTIDRTLFDLGTGGMVGKDVTVTLQVPVSK